MKFRWTIVLQSLVMGHSGIRARRQKACGLAPWKVSAESIAVKNRGWQIGGSETCGGHGLCEIMPASKPAKLADVAVGQRVVIHATPKATELIADEVKFAAAAPAECSRPPIHSSTKWQECVLITSPSTFWPAAGFRALAKLPALRAPET